MQTKRILSCLLFSMIFMGCQYLPFVEKDPFARIPAPTDKDPIVETVCIWEAAEGTGLNGELCKGFNGKVMFFTANRKEPVRVNGDIRVYVFDDLGTLKEQKRPIHHFDFEEGAFHAFLAETDLGFAYQFFIPYTRKTDYEANCALRIRMTPPSGRPVYSKMGKVTLSGRRAPEPPSLSQVEAQQTGGIVQVSHEVSQEDQHNRHPLEDQAAEYFGQNTLSKSTKSNEKMKRRLRSAMEQVVCDQKVSPNTGALDLTEKPIQSLPPEPAKHPLAQ